MLALVERWVLQVTGMCEAHSLRRITMSSVKYKKANLQISEGRYPGISRGYLPSGLQIKAF